MADQFGEIEGVVNSEIDKALQMGTKPQGVLILEIDEELYQSSWDAVNSRWSHPVEIDREDVVMDYGGLLEEL